VFSFYLILSVTVTAAHIAAEYAHTRNLVLKELEILEKTFQPPLEQALWEMNNNQLQSTLTGIMQLPNVVGIEIVNSAGTYVGAMGDVLHLSGSAIANKTDENQSDRFNGAVTVRTMAAQKERDDSLWIRFEVEDTGPGIREEKREEIFSPFTQLADLTHSEAGTGLGLAISKQYVVCRAHGGADRCCRQTG
jgi:light-regulated signal transduction histidine kinase (bacteriophytochrome)